MGYTAEVDRELCVSAGACVEAAPKAFGWDDDAKACPATAIHLYDEDGKEIDLFA